MFQLLIICKPTIPRISFNMINAEEVDYGTIRNQILDFGFTGKQ